METTPLARLETVLLKAAHAARAAGRAITSVGLVAVSKTQSIESVQALINAGQLRFGENRVQEAEAKFAALPARNSIELHLIGPLQTNKAKQAVELFDVIETLDRPELALALSKAMATLGKRPRLLVQVNIGREPQKAGVAPEELPMLLTYCRELNLPVEGLMCIPPIGAEAKLYFTHLAELAKVHYLKEVSMGMSADYETAIACGATYIRVGTALFGGRL